MVQRWWVVHVIVIVVVVVVVIMPVTVMARGAVAGGIEWQPYAAPLLPPEMRGFFRHTHEAYVDVPMCYAPAEMQAEGVRGRTFRLYVRRFSPTATPARHIWHVTGGPGVSSDGIERVLGTRFDDLAIYIMDPRGLDRSQEMFPMPNGRSVAEVLRTLPYPPQVISVHNSAQDYNHVTRLILGADGGHMYLHGSSYGAVLAYRAFLFAPQLYAGVLLDGFMPRYELLYRNDVAHNMAASCLGSTLCAARLPLKSAAEIERLMARITDDANSNRCKLAVAFVGSRMGQGLKFYLDHSIRRIVTDRPRFRGMVLPFLYHVAECPVPERFPRVLELWSGVRSGQLDEGLLVEGHGSAAAEVNRDYGRYLRFSEASVHPDYMLSVCKARGALLASSFTDACYVFSDYVPGYEDFLYVPQFPQPRAEALAQSATRLIVVSGKWDTQTPHELAEAEFMRLPLRDKHLFTAEHGAHGILGNSHAVGALTRTDMLAFLFEGGAVREQRLRRLFAQANGAADQVWQETMFLEPFRAAGLWDFDAHGAAPVAYEWSWFGVTAVVTFGPPVLTLLGLHLTW